MSFSFLFFFSFLSFFLCFSFFLFFLSLFFFFSLCRFPLPPFLLIALFPSPSSLVSRAPLFPRPPTTDHSYVEQLGTFMPIEAPQAGELVAFLVDEGNPVEYRQPVAEIAPFFGGHIIGDSKHA